MSADEIILRIDDLDKDERDKVFKHVFQKYFKDVWIVGNNYDWWDNELDDEYCKNQTKISE